MKAPDSLMTIVIAGAIFAVGWTALATLVA